MFVTAPRDGNDLRATFHVLRFRLIFPFNNFVQSIRNPLHCRYNDKYRRTIAVVALANDNSCPSNNAFAVLNDELIRRGLAWHYVRFSNSMRLDALEKEAHSNRAGLWLNDSAQPPWEFRKAARMRERRLTQTTSHDAAFFV